MARIRTEGKLTFLRVHELKTGFGPDSDKIEGEVVGRISSRPAQAFGFTLRRDDHLPAHQGMLDLMRDAFANDWTVVVEYDVDDGRSNGQLIRIELPRPDEDSDPRRRLLGRLLEARR